MRVQKGYYSFSDWRSIPRPWRTPAPPWLSTRTSSPSRPSLPRLRPCSPVETLKWVSLNIDLKYFLDIFSALVEFSKGSRLYRTTEVSSGVEKCERVGGERREAPCYVQCHVRPFSTLSGTTRHFSPPTPHLPSSLPSSPAPGPGPEFTNLRGDRNGPRQH